MGERPGPTPTDRGKNLFDAWFQVSGSLSGQHTGKTILSDDGVTLLFVADKPFSWGERVSVEVDPPAAGNTGLQSASFTFDVRAQPAPAAALSFNSESGSSAPAGQTAPTPSSARAAQKYVTLPSDFPNVNVTTPANGTAGGYLFLGGFDWYSQSNSPFSPYMMILDDTGDPVYFQKGQFSDFKKQPNGLLTYFDQAGNGFFALNNSYQIVDEFHSGNGYLTTDVHDLQILPNGHALLMIYDTQTMDMSADGGSSAARVTGLVIQELDQQKNVVFEWRSWDHFLVEDTNVSLTTAAIDYVHGNALELDQDGNILLSSRHLSEVTKINRQTGDIIWRLGGKNNQFTFVGDPNHGFYWQHDIRRLPNGDITLFDNRTFSNPVYSRAVEYQLDENTHIATLVWSYINPITTFTLAMGNTQRLPNGNTLIDWGSGQSAPPIEPFANLTEVKPDGSKALELSLPAGFVSYRGFRFPWHASPFWNPTLVVQNQAATTTLYYSWNGATDVAHYQVYASGKNNPIPTTLIADQAKTGFEDSTVVPDEATPYCYFQVKPIDSLGRPTRNSEVVPNPACFTNYPVYIPLTLGQ